MPKSNKIDAVLLEEPPILQDDGLPVQTPGRPSPFKKALTRVVDRFRVLFAKLPPLIESHPSIAGGAGVALVVVVAFGAWSLHRSRTTVPTNSRAAQIEKLENLARDAYKRAHYVLPVETSTLAYSKRVLKLDPSNNYSRTMLENSINGGKYQVQQALKHKDFAQAHRLANAMAQLMPGRKDIVELNQDVRIVERGATAPHRQEAAPPQKAASQKKAIPLQKAASHQKAIPGQKAASHQKAVPPQKVVHAVSFSAYHLHSEKAAADHGPYCLGILSVSGHHLKFSGQSASRSQKVHKFNFACSDIREIKKNARVASRQGGFHIRTASATMNFVPRDSSLTHVSAVASACSK